MIHSQLEELIAKHLEGTLNEGEKRLLASLLRHPEAQLYLAAKIDEQFLDPSLKELGDDATGKQIFQGIQQQLHTNKTAQHEQEPGKVIPLAGNKKSTLRWIAAAAVILLVVGLGIRFFYRQQCGYAVPGSGERQQASGQRPGHYPA